MNEALSDTLEEIEVEVFSETLGDVEAEPVAETLTAKLGKDEGLNTR